ncbi:Ubiquitin-conjugating enzyme E2 32, partial [Grifola frondosa]
MATGSGLNKNNSVISRQAYHAGGSRTSQRPVYRLLAAPLEDDIFEWHCTLRGPAGTEFEGGLYHFRILLPAEYPFRPPSIMMLTPNGRFELNTKICISFTNYHEELWQPAWGVRTAIIGLQGFFPLKGTAAVGVGALEYPSSERKRLASLSREWVCSRCNQSNLECLPDPPAVSASSSDKVATSEIPASSGTPTPAQDASSVISNKTPVDAPHVAQSPVILMSEPTVITPSIPLVAPKPIRPSARTSIVAHSLSPAPPDVLAPSNPPTRDQTPRLMSLLLLFGRLHAARLSCWIRSYVSCWCWCSAHLSSYF